MPVLRRVHIWQGCVCQTLTWGPAYHARQPCASSVPACQRRGCWQACHSSCNTGHAAAALPKQATCPLQLAAQQDCQCAWERQRRGVLADRQAQHKPDAECAVAAGPGEDLTLISTDIEGEGQATCWAAFLARHAPARPPVTWSDLGGCHASALPLTDLAAVSSRAQPCLWTASACMNAARALHAPQSSCMLRRSQT